MRDFSRKTSTFIRPATIRQVRRHADSGAKRPYAIIIGFPGSTLQYKLDALEDGIDAETDRFFDQFSLCKELCFPHRRFAGHIYNPKLRKLSAEEC